jgi:uncharacterized protein YbjT (DUF2867 family)
MDRPAGRHFTEDMFAITGITGHVGGATARALLAADAPLRAVVRNPASSGLGADVAVADFTDRTSLSAAFAGFAGAFVMLPTVPTFTDADHRRMADTIAAAVEAADVPHVVMLSSVGADLPDGTGPIRWLYHLEQALGATGAPVTALRSRHFQEKVEEIMDAVGAGVYPVFADSPDVPLPMVATHDVGEAAARALLSPPTSSEIIDLEAPAYTERELAAALSTLLHTDLKVVTIPRPAWLSTLTEAGVPPALAAELAELYDATNSGILQPRGTRRLPCTTPLDQTLRQIVASRRL